MKVVCYYAAMPGAHPHCEPADYDTIWPLMQKSVEAQGYELTHLTSLKEPAKCDSVYRVDIDPALVMFSREHAWLEYLKQLPEDETAVLVEPDAYLLRPIPELKGDMMLLERPGKSLPCGFRMATKRAVPFYEAVCRLYSNYDDDDKVFHGDVKVHHKLLKLGARGAYGIPNHWNGVTIERRDWLDYTSKRWAKAVAWNFKGTSKHIMLDMAKGKMPELR